MKTSASVPRLSLHQLSLYNTGRMPPEQVVAAFAVRQNQLDRIVADIAAEKPKSRPQHHLVVGQRGMGKTMLLARIAAELRTNLQLSGRFIPLAFVEEQYAVDRLSKFWLNCLDSLADAREIAGNPEGGAEIDRTVARLTATGIRAARDDQPFAEEVYAAFAVLAKTGGQRPVLLVDNLQLVFERLDPAQQHSLRELLMRPASPILVGASPSPPPESQDYGAAFYDHFKVHYLRPLDEGEMRGLLVHLAEVAERDDVRQRVLEHPARLKVLRQLTGGNPRTTLTLFFLYAEDFAPSVFGDLEGLLDRVTPLYKARFEELTPQQQVVASAIANHWDPITAADLSLATGLPPGTISSQLDRLEKTGVVERTELFGESRTGYQLAERFFNIWFLMRSASRRQRREVEFLTRFLENFYEPADRSLLARHLMAEEHFSADRYIWSRAVAASLTERETAEDLTRHAELAALREEASEARARLREVIDFDAFDTATLAFADLRKRLMSLIPEGAAVAPEQFAEAVLGDRGMFMNGEREKLAARPGTLNEEEIHSVLEAIRTARAADDRMYSPDAVAWFSRRLASGQILALGDVGDWNRAFLQAPSGEGLRVMVDSLPDRFGMALQSDVIEKIRQSLAPAAEDEAYRWNEWGILLEKLALPLQAVDAYREAIVRDPADFWSWIRIGDVLQYHLNSFDAAEAACREAIALKPNTGWPWFHLGNVLVRLHRHDDAEVVYREGIVLHPDHAWNWIGLGDLLESQKRYDEAESAFRSATRCDPPNPWPWVRLGILRRNRGRFAEAASAHDEAIRIGVKQIVHDERLFLRRDLLGEGSGARGLMDELPAIPESVQAVHLHEAVFAAYDSNWGLASEALEKAFTVDEVSPNTYVWRHTSAVLLHLGYGPELLSFIDRRGDTARMRPWVEALRALHLGDHRALQNVAPEIRTAAETLFDEINSHLIKLPDNTRRRSLPKEKATRTRRSKRR